MSRGRWIAAAAVVIVVAVGAGAIALLIEDEDDASAGELRFLRNATSSFDPALVAAENDSELQDFWRNHYWRMRGYAPFFDSHTFNGSPAWTPPPTHFYRDLYAIYNNASGERTIARHPDWVLRDDAGERLYIQYRCSRGTCPQFAADVGNPSFRAHWIKQARATLSEGYEGIHVDDVNLAMKVSNGAGTFTRPIDPRTGEPMTDADWRRYVAEFTEEIRAAFPNAEIVHNAIWFVGDDVPEVARAVAAADYVELERGASDPNLAPGSGRFGFETFLTHIEWLHDRGAGVIFEPYELNESRRQLELAVYFLTAAGGDAIASSFEADPDNWWPGWEADLGAPEGQRETWNGLLRRDFANGLVLVNPPGLPSRAVTVEGDYEDLDGEPVSSLSLPERAGIVLREAP